jgi:uncharacterized protein YkwD
MWAQFEDEVLLLTNEARAVGANCGGEDFAATGPLTMQPNLRCSARLHSEDMGMQDYFSHTSADGRTLGDRISASGYSAGFAGENIAWGQRTPQEVVDGWLESPGHCVNIMRPQFSDIGVGYWTSGGGGFTSDRYWTQNFGAPGRGR